MTTDSDFAVPQGELRALAALHWISRFGWLRALELGTLLWPTLGSLPGQVIADAARLNTQRKLAHKLVVRLRRSRLILCRPLPGNAGEALVLSAAGARYLSRRLGIAARPGDKWGRITDGAWAPPTSWEHELLATLVLLFYVSRGYEIRTELEIRAESVGLRKYPDGLAIHSAEAADGTKAEVALWIEVESSDKSGAKMKALARCLCDVARGAAAPISGMVAAVPLVVFRSDMVDLAGKSIDHEARIRSALQRYIGADLDLHFARIDFKNSSYHVRSIEFDLDAKILALDPNDPKANVSAAFAANREGTFINTSIDSMGRFWDLKVYRFHDRFRWEIWTRPEPGDGQPKMAAGYQVEKLEQGFRVAMSKWKALFFEGSYEAVA